MNVSVQDQVALIAQGKQGYRCWRCGHGNWQDNQRKLLHDLKINDNPTVSLYNEYRGAINQNTVKRPPPGWITSWWNCGRADCQATNFVAYYFPPPPPPEKCGYCKKEMPANSLKCPNCGAPKS